MTCREAAKIAQALGFPGYTTAAHSLANRPEHTGVMRVPALAEVFDGAEPKKPRKDGHRLQYRLSVRVTKEVYDDVKRILEEDGQFPTFNAFLAWWVHVWLTNKKKAAAAAATAETAKGNNTTVSIADKEE